MIFLYFEVWFFFIFDENAPKTYLKYRDKRYFILKNSYDKSNKVIFNSIYLWLKGRRKNIENHNH